MAMLLLPNAERQRIALVNSKAMAAEYHDNARNKATPNVGWDQRRFAAPAHHVFSTIPDGGPALEARWSHPTLNMGRAVGGICLRWPTNRRFDIIRPS